MAEVDHAQVRLYCTAIGESGAIHRDRAEAIRSGFRDIPTPEAFAFCIGMDEQPLMEIAEVLGLDPGRTLHAEQTFAFHSTLCVGDVVEITTELDRIFERKGGLLRFARLKRTLRDTTTGSLVNEQTILLVEVGRE
ncbi:MaoC family dehydratase N-terminal domain-containing protein [Erythrobacter sp. AP23]|uniref:FAS1-like dehydratase domain-containing protein n=1 Tax=Erythrobacter sp. AP23 TaxID=499656 RepID=UPI00076C3604|nr:MaoC family dehydratase N-terminal domain-containing protein [Erythrobacter sp. AP23]KWV93777.1 hypothetical protein ASS64_12845 [Erythrobacter sp. AP23]